MSVTTALPEFFGKGGLKGKCVSPNAQVLTDFHILR